MPDNETIVPVESNITSDDWKFVIGTSLHDVNLYISKKAEIMRLLATACVKATSPEDWHLIAGTPYLRISGAQKVRGFIGGNIYFIQPPTREEGFDSEGEYFKYTCIVKIVHEQLGTVESSGMATSRMPFHGKKTVVIDGVPVSVYKDTAEIDERAVRSHAENSAVAHAITWLIANAFKVNKKEMEDLVGGAATEYNYKSKKPSQEESDQGPNVKKLKVACIRKAGLDPKDLKLANEPPVLDILEKFSRFTYNGKEFAGTRDWKMKEQRAYYTLKSLLEAENAN